MLPSPSISLHSLTVYILLALSCSTHCPVSGSSSHQTPRAWSEQSEAQVQWQQQLVQGQQHWQLCQPPSFSSYHAGGILHILRDDRHPSVTWSLQWMQG